MKILKLSLIIIITFLSFQLYSQEYRLRGKVVSIQPQTLDTIAVNEAVVSLFSKGDDKKWINHATTITNNEGFYFFEKVKAGIYFVQINKKKNFKIIVAETKNDELQDLPIIIF